MTKERFLHIVSNPQDIASTDILDISKIEEKHPYFDAAKILKLNGLKQDDDITFPDYLKEVAYTLPDRKHLYILLHRKAVRDRIAEVVKDIHAQESDESKQEKDFTKDIVITDESSDTAIIEKDVSTQDELVNEAENTPSLSLPNDLIEKEIDNLTDSVLEDLLLKPLTAVYDIEKTFAGEEKLEESQEELGKEEELIEEQVEEEKQEEQQKDKSSTQPSTVKPVGERTFFDWLSPQTFEDESKDNDAESMTQEKSSSEIIDSFIASNPRISAVSKSSPQPAMDKYSVEDRDEIVTETLARIYLKQKNYSRAIKVYEQLSLKNPEKRAYFASQIHFLEKLLKDK